MNKDEKKKWETSPKSLLKNDESLVKIIGLVFTSREKFEQLEFEELKELTKELVEEFGEISPEYGFELDPHKYSKLDII